MIFLLKLGIFQPAMLVYQRVPGGLGGETLKVTVFSEAIHFREKRLR